MEQGGYANGSQNGAALNNTGSRYVPRLTSATEAAVLEEELAADAVGRGMAMGSSAVMRTCFLTVMVLFSALLALKVRR